MGKSNELYMTTQQSPDDSDYQYFQWLTDKEWQEYLEEERQAMEKKYRDFPATLTLKWAEFLIKNNLK